MQTPDPLKRQCEGKGRSEQGLFQDLRGYARRRAGTEDPAARFRHHKPRKIGDLQPIGRLAGTGDDPPGHARQPSCGLRGRRVGLDRRDPLVPQGWCTGPLAYSASNGKGTSDNSSWPAMR